MHGRAECRHLVGLTRGLDDVTVLGQEMSEDAAERVSGAAGIHGLDSHGLDIRRAMRRPAIVDGHPVTAHGHHHDALELQSGDTAVQSGLIGRQGSADETGQFRTVGNQHVRVLKQVSQRRHISRDGRGVQDERGGATVPCGTDHGGKIGLELGQDHVVGGRRQVGGNEVGVDALVGSRFDDDHVLAPVVDEDDRGARRGVVNGRHLRHVNMLARQGSDGEACLDIPADAGQQRHVAAHARRRDGLVGTLASWRNGFVDRQDRLAGSRDLRHAIGRVDVDGADDADPTRCVLHCALPSKSMASRTRSQ